MSADADITLSEWIKSFPERQVRARLAELERQRDALSHEIAALQAWIDLYRRITPSLSDDANGDAEEVPPAPAEARAKYPPKGVVAVRLLSEFAGRDLEFGEIRERLIARGEMGGEENEKHALRVALYKALKRGEVERPHLGRYRVPLPNQSLLSPEPEGGG